MGALSVLLNIDFFYVLLYESSLWSVLSIKVINKWVQLCLNAFKDKIISTFNLRKASLSWWFTTKMLLLLTHIYCCPYLEHFVVLIIYTLLKNKKKTKQKNNTVHCIFISMISYKALSPISLSDQTQHCSNSGPLSWSLYNWIILFNKYSKHCLSFDTDTSLLREGLLKSFSLLMAWS